MTGYDLAVALAKRWEEEGYTYEDLIQSIDEAVAEAQKWLRLKERIMKDKIYRDDAIDAIECVTWYHQNRNKDMVSGANSAEHQAWYKAEDIYEALEAVPSADRPQGGWIYGEHDVAMCDGYGCDRCGFFVPWDYEHKSIDFINDYNFCPHCGASMKGVDDE